MATIITTTFVQNSSRLYTAQIQIDGTTNPSELSGQAIIDSKAAISNIQTAVGMKGLPTLWKIDSIDWEFTGFTGVLIWDGSTSQVACALPQYDGRIDPYHDDGFPIVNGATAPTGKLLLTTKGLVAGMWGTIIIRGRHK